MAFFFRYSVRFGLVFLFQMIPIDILGTYFLACLVLAIVPGPDNIFVLTQSALQGKKAGLLVVLGLCTGLLFHTSAVALGVAVIFKTSELAFTLLKAAGAAYLLYLAWGAFRSGAACTDGNGISALGSGQLYRRGIFMNITNPKVSIFFLAFFAPVRRSGERITGNSDAGAGFRFYPFRPFWYLVPLPWPPVHWANG